MSARGVVGREGELNAAREFLVELGSGPRALVLEGEAGIGKTAVWRSALDEAAAQGFRVLSCVAEQAEARLAFVGLGDLVGDVADEMLPSLPEPQREALEVALIRRSRGQRAPDPRAIGVGLRSLVLALASSGPVVIAVDDAQWLDGASARVLAFLARRLGDGRVGLLLTVRTEATGSDPLGLERALGPGRLVRLRLGPLSAGAVHALLNRSLGYSYTRPTLRRIVEASGGNPLFALEIARVLGERPALAPGAPLPAPESLRELVAARVAAVAVEGRRSLLAASALSHPRDGLVVAVSSELGLRAAEASGLVRVEEGRVRFGHPLYGAAVYAGAPDEERRAVHRRLAELVEEPEERARHLALAAGAPDAAVAAELEAVAMLARSRGAWNSAGELLEQARLFTPGQQSQAALARAVRAADDYIHAGDRPRARRLLEALVAEIPAGPTKGAALRLLGDIRYNDDSYADAARLLEQALEYTDDDATAAGIELGLAFIHCNSWFDFARADLHAANGLALAEEAGDASVLAPAMAVRVMVDFLRGRGLNRAALERSLALEGEEHVLPVHMRPTLIAGLLMLYVGELDDARLRLTTLREAAVEAGEESDLAFVLAWLVWLETLAGRYEAAAAFADDAVVQSALAGSEATLAWVLAQRALLNAHRGELDAVHDDAAAATAIASRIGSLPPLFFVSTALVLLELSLGNAEAAWAGVAAMVEGVEANGLDEGDVLAVNYLPDALEALIALGELDRAGRLLEMFAARAATLDRPWALARGHRSRALLLAARGELDEARAAIDAALGEHRRIEMPLELGRTLLVQGRLDRRRRQRQAARRPLELALGIFESIGAPLWAGQARSELDRLGGPRGELSAAEQRVVALAVKGRSNKEIASALFLSVHTIEVHLSRAYRKLDVRSRTELMALHAGEGR